MQDPFPQALVLELDDLQKLLRMDARTLDRFLKEEATFPKAVNFGSKRRRRWDKEAVLRWVFLQMNQK